MMVAVAQLGAPSVSSLDTGRAVKATSDDHSVFAAMMVGAGEAKASPDTLLGALSVSQVDAMRPAKTAPDGDSASAPMMAGAGEAEASPDAAVGITASIAQLGEPAVSPASDDHGTFAAMMAGADKATVSPDAAVGRLADSATKTDTGPAGQLAHGADKTPSASAFPSKDDDKTTDAAEDADDRRTRNQDVQPTASGTPLVAPPVVMIPPTSVTPSPETKDPANTVSTRGLGSAERDVASTTDTSTVNSDTTGAITSADGNIPADPALAPVLAALADSQSARDTAVAAAGFGPAAAASAAAADAAPMAVQPSTAAMMATRPLTTNTAAISAKAKKATNGSDADPDTADTANPVADAPVRPENVLMSTSPVHGAKTSAATAVPTLATGQLAAGGADRQVDLAKQGAWLDGLAHDIAATGDGSSPLRFSVAPQHLGQVMVELSRDGDGSSVTLTASNEASRAALADARPQLVADARAQGIHIASAQVGTGSSDSRASSQGQSDSRQSSGSSAGGGSFSSQNNAQGESGRQSQTRSQPLAVNPASRTGAPDAEQTAAEPIDGIYA